MDDYNEDIKIDADSLDVEWLNQPALAMQWGVHWATCFKIHQQAEENVKLTRSELIKEVNENPEKCLGQGIKPTAPVVEAYYRNHEKHKKAKEELIEAQFELNIATVAKGEFSSGRKEALKNEVILHGQGYFAGPSVPRDLSFEAQKARKQEITDAKIGDKMKRKRK